MVFSSKNGGRIAVLFLLSVPVMASELWVRLGHEEIKSAFDGKQIVIDFGAAKYCFKMDERVQLQPVGESSVGELPEMEQSMLGGARESRLSSLLQR